MNRRKKSKEYLLNRIIIAQVIVFLVLFLALQMTKKEPASEPTELKQTVNLSEQQLEGENESVEPSTMPTVEPGPTDVPSTEVNLSVTPTIVEEQTITDDLITNQAVPAFAQGMSNEFIESLLNTQEGTLIQKDGINDLMYYAQTDSRWAQKFYGEKDTIEEYGCGPTSMSIVISSMTSTLIDPVQMCAWAYEKGYWYSKSGSTHNLIPEAAMAFGLKAQGVENSFESEEKLRTALEQGNMVVALMGSGSFTKSGHFIVFYGLNEDGLVYVADPASEENTNKTWELSQLMNEAKPWAAANGPFWIISP